MRFDNPTRRGAALLAVATAGALLASGCSAGSLGSSSDAGASGEATTITYLVDNSDTSVKSANDLVSAFQAANSDIKVTVDTRPAGSDGDNLVKTRLSTGDMAEVFGYNNGSLMQALKPAQNLTDLSDQSWASNVDDAWKTSTTADGKLYGGPVGTAFGGGVLYNIPAFQKAGVEVPKTWDDFMAAAKTFKDAGVTPVEQTYGETWTSQLFVLGDYANVEKANPDFASQYTAGQQKYATNAAALAGFQHIQQVHDAGYFNKDFASAKLNDGIKAVADGDAAMYPQLGAVAAGIESVAPGKSADVGFFALPGSDAATNTLTVWPGNALYIPKTVEGAKLDAAKKFVDFATTQAGCDAQIKNNPPAGPFLSKACQLPSDVSQVAKDTQAYFTAGNATPALEFKSPIKGPALEQICIQVGTGQETAEKAAALYDNDVKKQAEQLGLPGWD